MSDDLLDVRVAGADELVRISRALKAGGRKDLSKELNAAIRASTAPLVSDLKSAITSLPVTGVRGGGSAQRHAHRGGKGRVGRHGLRASIARSIQTKITTSGYVTGIRVRVDTSKLPPDQRKLPRALNSAGGWRHPVFGSRKVMAAQKGGPWWSPTIDRHRSSVREGITATLARYADQLT